MSDNLAAAQRLAALGIAVFPCAPDKKPRPGVRWKEEASKDGRRLESQWHRWPSSVPAFSPGAHGMVCIDCDRKPGQPDGVEAFAQLAASHELDLREVPCVETPSGGRHYFFRQPAGAQLGNGRGTLPAGIDVRGLGGYVVAEGATLPDGRSYHCQDGHDGLLDALSVDAVPACPDWLEFVLLDKPAPPAPAVKPAHVQLTSTAIGRREEAAFAKALDDEAANVRGSIEGTRNQALNTAAFNLGQMVAAGWGSRAVVEAELTAAALDAGLRGAEIAKTIASGLRGGAANPRRALADRQDAVAIMDPSPLLAGADMDPEPEQPIEQAEPLPDALTRPGGFMGELIDWIVDTGPTGNRVLALSAALPLLATMLGRRVATPTQGGGGLELYVIVTYATGGGKSHQMRAVQNLLKAAKLDRHVTSTEYSSDSYLDDSIARTPLLLSIIDEYAKFLGKITNERSSHHYGIGKKLTQLFGAGFATYETGGSRTKGTVPVYGPCLSIYGMTTRADLFRVVKGRMISDGLVNRHTFIDGGAEVARKPLRPVREVPESLVAGLRTLYEVGKPRDQRGNMTGVWDKNTNPDPDPFIIPWASLAAEQAFDDFEAECRERKNRDLDLGDVYARTAFQAIKMATILACADNPARPAVDVRHVRWGAAIAINSADAFYANAQANMVDPLGAAEFERKIVERLRAAPGQRLRKRDLHKSMSKHQRFAFDLENALKALNLAGVVVIEKVNADGRGRPAEVVKLI